MYDGKCRELILNVIQFMEEEKNNLTPVLPLTSVMQRAARALKISVGTLRNITAEVAGCKEKPTCRRERKKLKTADLPSGITSAIRDEIYKMHKENLHFTIKTLREHLAERELYTGSVASLRKLLLNSGFHFRKHNGRKALCEKPHVILKRVRFLREFKRLQALGYNFVFLDETWIFSKGGNKHIWTDDSVNCCRKSNTGDGKRYIILHAGGKLGFIEGADLIFSSKNKSHDYHDSMTAELFQKWFTQTLIPSLEGPTVIVIDNATYHSALAEKTPNSSWRKADIQMWLQHNKIAYDQNAFKKELLDMVAKNKKEPEYKIDKIAGESGHIVLRLPPYHCHFNPIEHIWALTKRYYDSHIGPLGFNEEGVLATWKKALDNITVENWNNCVRHCENVIEASWQAMHLMDRADQELIISLDNDDDSDSDIFDPEDSDKENEELPL